MAGPRSSRHLYPSSFCLLDFPFPAIYRWPATSRTHGHQVVILSTYLQDSLYISTLSILIPLFYIYLHKSKAVKHVRRHHPLDFPSPLPAHPIPLHTRVSLSCKAGEQSSPPALSSSPAIPPSLSPPFTYLPQTPLVGKANGAVATIDPPVLVLRSHYYMEPAIPHSPRTLAVCSRRLAES